VYLFLKNCIDKTLFKTSWKHLCKRVHQSKPTSNAEWQWHNWYWMENSW